MLKQPIWFYSDAFEMQIYLAIVSSNGMSGKKENPIQRSEMNRELLAKNYMNQRQVRPNVHTERKGCRGTRNYKWHSVLFVFVLFR